MLKFIPSKEVKTYQWSTREQWAKERRTGYYDRFDDLQYGPPAFNNGELETAIQALRSLWKSEGVRLRAMNVPKGLTQQPGEHRREWYQRYQTMTEAERELLNQMHCCQGLRSQINLVIKELQQNKNPNCNCEREIEKLIKPVTDGWQREYKAAEEKREQEILATPIDDEAWAEELRHREYCERTFKGIRYLQPGESNQ